MFAAIRAASMRNVPEPHIGSAKSQSPRQPVLRMIPAARTSLIGASVCSARYPRLERGSPLESSEMVTRLSEICTSKILSGLATLIDGRLPHVSEKWSTMPSLTL